MYLLGLSSGVFGLLADQCYFRYAALSLATFEAELTMAAATASVIIDKSYPLNRNVVIGYSPQLRIPQKN